MTKTDLINVVNPDVPELNKAQVKAVIDSTLVAIKAAVANGETVALKDFGTFKRVDVKEREARNPSTGDTITIKAHKKPVFKASPAFKDDVNKNK